MRPKWPKLASLAQKYAHYSFSYLVHSLLPKDNLFKNIFEREGLYHDGYIEPKKGIVHVSLFNKGQYVQEIPQSQNTHQPMSPKPLDLWNNNKAGPEVIKLFAWFFLMF